MNEIKVLSMKSINQVLPEEALTWGFTPTESGRYYECIFCEAKRATKTATAEKLKKHFLDNHTAEEEPDEQTD